MNKYKANQEQIRRDIEKQESNAKYLFVGIVIATILIKLLTN